MSPPCAKVQSNLESFLRCVTPVVPSSPLPMDLREAPNNKESNAYFVLGNLWQVYNEWSVFGVGVPVSLSSGETVVQYYTPHLSAIQLYTNRKKIGDIAEVSNNNISGTNGTSSLSDNSSETSGTASISSSIAHDSLQPVKGCDSPARLYFKYDEIIPPYWRIPLVDKIAEIAETLPELITLKNTELSPASWISIAWSPIYHIPYKGKVEDMSTHFLTYHTLSSHFQDIQANNNISLPPFGLSTLKMQGNVWINQDSEDYEKLINLHYAADSWLKHLRVQHRDFDYYKRKNLEAGGEFK